MNGAQLSAYFAAHKTAILGSAAAGVAGLALLQKKKSSSSTAAASVPGTIPAAAVVSAGGTTGAGGYDSSAYDVYSALQSELTPLLQQQAGQTGGGGITTAPTPVASSLLAPSDSGKYVAYSDGLYEVEGDNSLLHLQPSQWQQIVSSNKGKKPSVFNLKGSGKAPTNYTTTANLQNQIAAAAPKA